MIAILLLGLVLRAWHLGEGLPEFTDEAYPLRTAFQMAGWERGNIDWNPHIFFYPSVAFLLHLVLQSAQYQVGRIVGYYTTPADMWLAFHTDPSVTILVARGFGMACGLALIWLAWRVAERLRRGAGPLAAAWMSLAPGLVLSPRIINVDAPMAVFSLAALDRVLAYRASRRSRDLAAGVVLAGLATATKYSAALLIVPVLLGALSGGARFVVRRVAWSVAGMVATFMVTSPFVWLDFAHARAGFVRTADLLSAGQLGSFSGAAGVLWGELRADLGWPGLAFVAISLAGFARSDSIRQWTSTHHDRLCVALFAVAFALPPFFARSPYARYLLPALPALAALAAAAAVATAERFPLPRAVRIAAFALLAVPVAWGGWSAAASGGDTTQGRARRWLEGRVGHSALIVQEAYAAPLQSCPESVLVAKSPAFQRASRGWRERFDGRPTRHVVVLPLVVSGRGAVAVPAPGGASRWLDVWANASDVNMTFYDPSILAAADIVVTSGSVRGRYQADPARYGAALRCYDDLDRSARRLAQFRSGPGVTGPELIVYEMSPELRRSWSAAGGNALWWVRDVSPRARRELQEAMTGAEPDTAGSALAPRTPSGAAAPWVVALGGFFDREIAPFAWNMTGHLFEMGRIAETRPFVETIMTCGDPEGPMVARVRNLVPALEVATGTRRDRPPGRPEEARSP